MSKVTLDHIDGSTPMGATLRNGGATFRVWAPALRSWFSRADGLKMAIKAGRDGTARRMSSVEL